MVKKKSKAPGDFGSDPCPLLELTLPWDQVLAGAAFPEIGLRAA